MNLKLASALLQSAGFPATFREPNVLIINRMEMVYDGHMITTKKVKARVRKFSELIHLLRDEHLVNISGETHHKLVDAYVKDSTKNQ